MSNDQSYRVFVNQDGVIIGEFLKIIHDVDENFKRGQSFVNEIVKTIEQNPQVKTNVLIDLLALGKSTYVASDTRKSYMKALNHPQIRKVAVVGESVAYKVLFGFMILALKKQDSLKWFSDKDQALSWLRE